MELIKENKLFLASSLATFCFGVYLLKDSIEKIHSFFSPSNFDDAELMETASKIINSPENKRNNKQDTNIKQSKSLPLYRICLTGGPCGGKTTGTSSFLIIFKRLLWL